MLLLKFQPTPPVWAETRSDQNNMDVHGISTHSARVGGDTKHPTTNNSKIHFNPLRPCGRRLFGSNWRYNRYFISTHSARVGGDFRFAGMPLNFRKFQPTPPVWAETRQPSNRAKLLQFQPTPPVWAETRPPSALFIPLVYFNPLRPCGRRPHFKTEGFFSIDFNPLRPCGRRQLWQPTANCSEQISTHSARVGGDWPSMPTVGPRKIFQPTPPVWAETDKRKYFGSK